MFINGHVILGPQGWLAPLLCEKAIGAYGRISPKSQVTMTN